MANNTAVAGGAFNIAADYHTTGNWIFDGTVTGNFIDTGSTLASPAITGTVTGGASYTAPTLTSPTITGTTAIGNGATLTTPVLSGTVTGTYTLGGTPTLASAAGVPYVGGVAAGYKLARSPTPAAVTGTLDVVTGLTTVVACGADADSDFDGDALAAVQAVNTGGAGHILLKCWKVTTGGAAGNPTMIAATAAKNVNWWAIGT